VAGSGVSARAGQAAARAGAQVAAGLPTVVTVAATDDLVAGRAQYLLSTPRFRCYRTTDVQGAPYPNPSVP